MMPRLPGVDQPANTSDEAMTRNEHRSVPNEVPDLVVKPGRNHAYRGVEQHGVPTVYEYEDPDPVTDVDQARMEFWSREGVSRYYEPVKVEIVSTDYKRFTAFSARQYVLSTTPLQVVGRRAERRFLRLTNLDTTTVIYFSEDPSALTAFQHPIYPAGSIELPYTNAEVYASAASGTPSLGVVEVFETMEDR